MTDEDVVESELGSSVEIEYAEETFKVPTEIMTNLKEVYEKFGGELIGSDVDFATFCGCMLTVGVADEQQRYITHLLNSLKACIKESGV